MAGGSAAGDAGNCPRTLRTGRSAEHGRPFKFDGRIGSSDLCDVGSLRPLLTLHDLELDVIAFLQGAITIADNRSVVHEDVGPVFATDETITLGIVKPLDSTDH